MTHTRLALLLIPVLAFSSPAQEERATSQPPTIDLEKALKTFLLEKKDQALRDCLMALAQKGKEGTARLATLTARVMKVAKKTVGEGKAGEDGEAPKEATAWLEDLISPDESKAEAAAAKLTEAGKAVAAPMKQLAMRTDALYGRFVVDHIMRQLNTRAIYAGQYKGLRDLGTDVEKVLVKFAKEAPPGVTAGDQFRVGAIRALRDVVDKPSEELLKLLTALAKDDFEEAGTQRNAMYALAQFGDKSLIDAEIKKGKKLTESEDTDNQAEGWIELAGHSYELRDYQAAIDSYKKALAMAEEGKWKPNQMLPTHYYNAACSMSLAGKIDEAFEYIDKAMVAGRKSGQQGIDRSTIQSDKDIENLRKDARFEKMFDKYFGKPASKPATEEGKEQLVPTAGAKKNEGKEPR